MWGIINQLRQVLDLRKMPEKNNESNRIFDLVIKIYAPMFTEDQYKIGVFFTFFFLYYALRLVFTSQW